MPAEPGLVVLKKLGAVAAIDALSKVGTRQDGAKNRERFVTFIRKFSDWSDCERMSLPHLVQALSKDMQPEFEQLKRYAGESLRGWRTVPPGPWSITQDPLPDQLLELWPKEGSSFKRVMPRFCNEHFRHVHLFYSYRNYLAHNLREGGWPTIERGVTFPHYLFTEITRVVSADSVSLRERWLLYYPLPFFLTLANGCLDRLEAWLKAECINPFDYYPMGDFLLEFLE